MIEDKVNRHGKAIRIILVGINRASAYIWKEVVSDFSILKTLGS